MADVMTGGGAEGGERGALPMFRGISRLALDAKGRLAIPSRNRMSLANGSGRIVITADPSRCLLVYPLDAWEPIQARLMSLSSFDERIRALQRLLVGYADDVDIDAAGRVLVPPPLREFASLAQGRRAGGTGPADRVVGRGGMGRADSARARVRRG